MDLVFETYRVTRAFPAEEKYGLASHLRRSACSVPSNIAEGHCRRYRNDYFRFVRIAYGSLGELETQLLIADRLQYVESAQMATVMTLCNRLRQMLSRLSNRLQDAGTPDPGPQTPGPVSSRSSRP